MSLIDRYTDMGVAKDGRCFLTGDELLDYATEKYNRGERRVVLAFSASKDSLVCFLRLRDLGYEVHPYFMYLVPGLEYDEIKLRYYENYFGTKIMRLPHPHFYINLTRFNYQPPERVSVIRSIMPMSYSVPDIDTYLCQRHGAGFTVYGTRWSDNSVVRQSIQKHGAIFDSQRAQRVMVYAVWNYTNDQVADAIIKDGVKISDEYRLFLSPIRGFQYNFLKGIQRHYPGDYEKIKFWFPLIDLELYRFEEIADYANSKKREAQRPGQGKISITGG